MVLVLRIPYRFAFFGAYVTRGLQFNFLFWKTYDNFWFGHYTRSDIGRGPYNVAARHVLRCGVVLTVFHALFRHRFWDLLEMIWVLSLRIIGRERIASATRLKFGHVTFDSVFSLQLDSRNNPSNFAMLHWAILDEWVHLFAELGTLLSAFPRF